MAALREARSNARLSSAQFTSCGSTAGGGVEEKTDRQRAVSRSHSTASSGQLLRQQTSPRRGHVSIDALSAMGMRLIQKDPTTLSESGSDSESEEEAQGEYDGKISILLQSLTSRWGFCTENKVIQLIKMKADVTETLPYPWDPAFKDFRQSVGGTALHFASRLGLVEAVSALLEFRAVVDSKTDTGTTPLMVSVMFAQPAVTRRLIEAQASVQVQDARGFNVCDLAVLEGETEILDMLLAKQHIVEMAYADQEISAALAAGADISLLPPMPNFDGFDEDEELLAGLELIYPREGGGSPGHRGSIVRELSQQSLGAISEASAGSAKNDEAPLPPKGITRQPSMSARRANTKDRQKRAK